MSDNEFVVLMNAIVYAVPVVALIVSIITFYNASKERHTKSAAEQARIGIKLDNNSKKLDDIDTKVDELGDGYHENHESIEKHEQRIENLETRAEKLEDRMDKLEDRVTEFHTH